MPAGARRNEVKDIVVVGMEQDYVEIATAIGPVNVRRTDRGTLRISVDGQLVVYSVASNVIEIAQTWNLPQGKGE